MKRGVGCRVEECPRDGLKAFDVDGSLRVLVATSGRLYLVSPPAAGDRSSSKET